MEKVVSMKLDFWRGKKVFLTGHTGFKGAWLSEILIGAGATVTGYALAPPTSPSLFDLLGLEKRLAHYQADILDAAKLSKALRDSGADIVFHLAAQPIVRKSYTEPVETMATNIMGTVHLLEAIRHTPSIKSVIIVTSDKCYLNEETGAYYTENDKLGGKDPYSASKAAAEVVTHAYDESYFAQSGTAVASVRAGNVIGGGDWALDRLIPDCARAATSGGSVNIRNPASTRPWQHVLEPLRGYMMLAEKLYTEGQSWRGGWNFGPVVDDIRPVSDVLTTLKKHMPFTLEMDTSPQPHEAKRLGLDITKARTQLGWQPQIRLADAVAMTGDWYLAQQKSGDMAALTRRQINDYFGAA